jgi:hypothetical protein
VASLEARTLQGPVTIPGTWRVEYGRVPLTTPVAEPGNGAMADGPDSTIYSSDQPYPAVGAELAAVQRLAGYDIAFIRLFPLRFIPAKGELVFTPQLRVAVTLEAKPAEPKAGAPPLRIQTRARDHVAGWVENPTLVDAYPASASGEKAGESFDYLLITRSNLVSAFQPLIDLKTQSGLAVKVETVETITNTQLGVDVPEKIRNYIRSAYTNWGITYVLLGGDTATVPCRYAYVSMGSLVQNPIIPCDLYYACLDGSWNSDGNARWGEPADGDGGSPVDLLAEVYVGRAPVDTAAEVGLLVEKTVRYTTQAHPNLTNALFLAEFLANTPGGPAQGGDMFDPLVPLFTGYEVTWLDDRPETTATWDKADAFAALNESPHLALLNGHGNDSTLIGLNYPFYRSIETPDLLLLTNQWPFLAYSVGCNVGQFDNNQFLPDAIGEELVKNHSRGAFGAVLNSRLGWYDQQDEAKYSGEFQHQFFDQLLSQAQTNLGVANQLGKQDLVAHLETAGIMTYRFCYYEITLLGDPHLAWQLPSRAPDTADPDGDGMPNWQEAVAGTSPTDASSVLRLRVSASGSAAARLEWPSVAGRVYTVWRADDPSGPFAVLTGPVPATPPLNSLDETKAGSGSRFYRVEVQTEP